MVLSQDIISTPRADFDRSSIEHNGDSIADVIIDNRQALFKGLKRGLVIEGGMFADIVVVIVIPQ